VTKGRKKKESEVENGCCASSWKVESLISIDERGQMVLPKDLRERARIKPGDKLALISWEKENEVCCFYLIKAEQLAETARVFLGSLVKDMAGS
jgi:AbrB family looped-hinge helix DNA binding protein